MATRFALLLVALLTASAPAALAANRSLPCTANGPKIKACQDAAFSQAATGLAATFDHTEHPLSQPARAAVESDRANWLSWTQRICPAQKAECLTPLYQSEASMLAEGSTQSNGVVIYPRAQYRIGLIPQHSPQRPRTAHGNLSLGVSAVSWPQIDHPDEAQQRWNRAMRETALAMSVRSDKQDKLFSPFPLNGKQVSVTYQMEPSNARLMQVRFTLEVAPNEAAHPATTVEQSDWWLTRGRNVEASDLFHGANWQKQLTRLSAIALTTEAKQSNGELVLFEPAEWQPQLMKIVTDPKHWTLTREGLLLTLPRYAVAAGVYGNPQVLVTWKQLRRSMNRRAEVNSFPARTRTGLNKATAQ